MQTPKKYDSDKLCFWWTNHNHTMKNYNSNKIYTSKVFFMNPNIMCFKDSIWIVFKEIAR